MNIDDGESFPSELVLGPSNDHKCMLSASDQRVPAIAITMHIIRVCKTIFWLQDADVGILISSFIISRDMDSVAEVTPPEDEWNFDTLFGVDFMKEQLQIANRTHGDEYTFDWVAALSDATTQPAERRAQRAEAVAKQRQRTAVWMKNARKTKDYRDKENLRDKKRKRLTKKAPGTDAYHVTAADKDALRDLLNAECEKCGKSSDAYRISS
jgi:hypothetical protein